MSAPHSVNPENQTGSIPQQVFKIILSVFLTFLTTACLLLIRDQLTTTTVALLFFIPILISTTLWGLWSGVLSAITAFLTYNYFFLQPYNTFIVHETQDLVALILFLVIAIVISQLIGRARANLAAAVARENETTRLYELSLDLTGANSPEEIVSVLARKTTDTVPAARLEVDLPSIFDKSPFRMPLTADSPLSQEPDVTIPLETVRAYFGEIRIWLDRAMLSSGENRLLHAFAAQGALALERMVLANAETRAKVLEESDRLKSALLSSVSHEFRTPIATIKAATSSLLIDEIPWEAPDRVDLLTAVDEEIDHLNYLVGNLLDMSRIEAGALQPDKQWNVLIEIIDSVVKRFRRLLKNFHVDIQVPDDLPLVPVDYSQMEQVFSNLLHNSVKYAPEQSLIKITAEVVNSNTLKVKITNEGPQIAPEDIDRIFEKFYRVTKPEKVGGTGLGLSICKGIIEAHDGRIWAENHPGGLAFIFTLPLTLNGNPPPKVET